MVHVLVIKDVDTGQVSTFSSFHPSGQSIHDGLSLLGKATMLIGHNIIKFDLAVLAKLHSFKVPQGCTVMDTLVLTRLIYTRLSENDFRLISAGTLPKGLYCRHSLAAWGYRLGKHKGDFKGPWDAWSQDMETYCEQDVEVNYHLWQFLEHAAYPEMSIWIEHEVAKICAQIEINGFCVDVPKLEDLFLDLKAQFERVRVEMQVVFPPAEVQMKTKVKYIPFNPGSRKQIEERLKEKYDWVPKAFTDNGQAKLDDEVLATLKYPEAQVLARYFLLQKRIGQIGEGQKAPNAWLQMVRKGKLHGAINPNGARTGRATHSHPNMGQIPSKGVEYGKECREAFTVPPGWKLLGTDAGQLELRMLAHYMALHDLGAYTSVVNTGDVHTTNQIAAGLPTRDDAKTFIYGFIYGAGDAKIGSIVGKGRAAGKKLRESFLKGLPALDKLIRGVKSRLKSQGYLTGLDGRRLYCEHEHAALNTLLQSAGALVCKVWMIIVERMLQEKGLVHGWHGQYAICAWVHDELQIAVRDGYEDVVGQACLDAIAEVEKFFKLRCPLTANFKVGANWYETH